MGLRAFDLLTAGAGNSYLLSFIGAGAAAGFDAATGISVAFRVTWNSGHQSIQFPPFKTTIHDAGTFVFATDVNVEVVYSDNLAYVGNFSPGTRTRVAPGDVQTALSGLGATDFMVLAIPLGTDTPHGAPGSILPVLPPGQLPGLTCKYRGADKPFKPGLYISHVMSLNEGVEFRDARAGGTLYTTPNIPVAIHDGIEVVTAASPAQFRWLYGVR